MRSKEFMECRYPVARFELGDVLPYGVDSASNIITLVHGYLGPFRDLEIFACLEFSKDRSFPNTGVGNVTFGVTSTANDFDDQLICFRDRDRRIDDVNNRPRSNDGFFHIVLKGSRLPCKLWYWVRYRAATGQFEVGKYDG